jgi:dipeptidyl-peptidase-3
MQSDEHPTMVPGENARAAIPPAQPSRRYLVERIGEAAVVQLYADAFRTLPLRDKLLIWHLSQAAVVGRDIYYDQRYAHNLAMRDLLEAVVTHPSGIDTATLDAILTYTKLFWINTGPYNNLTARKFVPACSIEAFAAAVHVAVKNGAQLPLRAGESIDELLERMTPLLFDRSVDPCVTNKTPSAGTDILVASANNLYGGVAMEDLAGFDERFPLNSRLTKRDGLLVEEVYRVGGRYSAYIERIVESLERALPYATPSTARALEALIRFYRTGSNDDRRAYDIAWVADRDSPVDTINGFVEVYLDARGRKGAWEALVYYVNREKTAAIRQIADHAQWFEDHMPWDPRYRKPRVTGVTACAIDVVIETGDAGPMTPVGINLPNDQEIRELYGSKSVSLSNVTDAYEQSTPLEFRTEFAWDEEEVARALKWSAFASELTTCLHEVIGHGSGIVAETLKSAPDTALKEQYSTIEESRADLVALYFVADPHLAALGLISAEEQPEMVRAEYEAYARNALVQLRRIREGSQIEEDHMRNRQLIVHWLLANTAALKMARREGRTYYRVLDVNAFRSGVARLLADVQRIKAEGDYASARVLVETYGVYFDSTLRDEIVARVERLQLPSYTAFVMPRLNPLLDQQGGIMDVEIAYPMDLTTQMLEYADATRDLRTR